MIRRLLSFASLAALLAAGVPAAAQPCGANGVALQVLGSGGPELAAKRAGSGVLVWIDGSARVLVDAGGGVALRYAESGAQLRDLDVLLLTRLHADHTSDLPALVHASRFENRTQTLPIYGPPGSRGMPSTVAFVRDLFDGTRGAWRHLGEFIAPLEKSSYKLAPRDVREPPPKIGLPRPKPPALLPVFTNPRLEIGALPTTVGTAPALAFRIQAGGKSIVIGDADEAGLAILAAGADLLIAAHTVPAGADTNGSALGRLARDAKVKQLVFTQRSPATLGREEPTLAAIRKSFAGPVHFADDLSCYQP